MTVDSAGNVYIADTGNNAIKEWNATTQTVRTLVSRGECNPVGVAVDGAGNVYIADSGNNAIKEWNRHDPDDQHPGLLGLNTRVAWRWTARATSISPMPTTTRSRSGTPRPDGHHPGLLGAESGRVRVAVDEAGNVYFADEQCDRGVERHDADGQHPGLRAK